MTNDLVDPNKVDYDKLREQFGQGQSGGDYLPRLLINQDHEDEQDPPNPLPVGSFHFKYKTDKDETLEFFSPRNGPVLFRPYYNTYRYEKYDSDKNKVVSRSVYIKNWSEEIIDDMGGERCGKLSRDAEKDADVETLKQSKMVNAYRVLWGEVKFPEATDRKGNKVELDWTPCTLRMRGTNFMPFGDVVRDLDALKKLMFQQEFSLTLEKKTQGTNKWYIIHFNYDATKSLPIDQHVVDLAKMFDQQITKENKEVFEAHTKALRRKTSHGKVDQELSNDLDSDFDKGKYTDLDDEIPF